MQSAIFLDKDGTIIEDVPYNVDPERIRLAPGAASGLRLLGATGLPIIVVTNQSGVAHGFFQEESLRFVRSKLAALMAECGAVLTDFYYCPHHPGGAVAAYTRACECRKPRPGMLLAAARDHDIDLGRSWLVGDILHDIEAGRRAGCRTVLIVNGNETEWVMGDERLPHYMSEDLAEAAHWLVRHLEVA